jgi:electron transfer flavoprotein alpha subunit
MNQDIYVVIEHLRGQVAEISYVMLAAARALSQGTQGKVVAVLLGHNVQGAAEGMEADQVLVMDHPALAEFTSHQYQEALAHLANEHKPRVWLFGHTSLGMDVAGVLSVRLGVPLVSACQSFHFKLGTPYFVSQICGGKIMAEGELPAPTAMVTVIPGGYKPEQGRSSTTPPIISVSAPALGDSRVTLKQYIEPETGDVDISKESILVAVGRGIQNQDNLELAEELANALGGVVCASRPIVDQGWMPTSRLVGKSGKSVKPKVYLALGISGAPEHVEGISGSDTIIAVNTDPLAPIFNLAKYGTTVDVLELAPQLTQQIQQAKSG